MTPVSEALPETTEAIKRVAPYGLLAVGVVAAFALVIATWLDEHTASGIVPVVMLVLVIYDKTRGPMPDDEPAHETDPGAGLEGARLLATLESAYREALVLTKFEGYSLEEAATRAGVSTGAMKTRVHRALRTLQKRLREEGLP